MSEFDIDLVLKELSGERKLFHSEADFQFALAWKIQQKYTDAKVRLEYCMNLNKQAMHIDMVVFLGEKIIPIELKYKTIRCDEINIDGETYILKNHGAQDMGRYDFVKDIKRIETIIDSSKSDCGYAIMLTNDSLYWKDKKTKKSTISDDFRIHENTTLSGERKWINNPSKGTIKGRESSIELANTYEIKWNPYSMNPEENASNFYYTIVNIYQKER